MDEMQPALRSDTQTANVAGVVWDFRFDEDDVEHWVQGFGFRV
jgi:hypothetical protein